MKHYFLASSALVASGSAYLLNISLIYILSDSEAYAHFLSLNSWAVFLASVAYLLILDLHLGPNRAHYRLDDLMGISGLAILVSVTLIGLVAVMRESRDFWAVTVAMLGFSTFKLASQYFIYFKKIVAVTVLRYVRAALILSVVGLMFAIDERLLPSAGMQVALQGVICIVTLIFAQALFGVFRRVNPAQVAHILRLDGRRLLTRLVAFLVDTIHMPIFYYLLSRFSPDLPGWFIYALGVILPAAYVISALLREQVLIRDDLVESVLRSRLGAWLMFVYGLGLFGALSLYLSAQIGALAGLGGLLAGLITFSGAIGTVLYRHGLEALDLGLNLCVFGLLALLFLQSGAPGALHVVKLAILFLAFKYTAQMGIAFVALRTKQ